MTSVLKIIGPAILAFIVYLILKKYVFSKFKVNKQISIGILVVTFVGSMILSQVKVLQGNTIFPLVESGIFVVILLWTMDNMGFGLKYSPEKNDLKNQKAKYASNSVIKSKAKPNRLRNTDMEVINIEDIRKKRKNKK